LLNKPERKAAEKKYDIISRKTEIKKLMSRKEDQ
jgi:hypothetical protein